MNTKTQCLNILKHLRSGKPITAIQALKLFGCQRLAARIYDLKQRGIAINSHRVKSRGKWFAEYSLASDGDV